VFPPQCTSYVKQWFTNEHKGLHLALLYV
jgi:hypothetical protein